MIPRKTLNIIFSLILVSSCSGDGSSSSDNNSSSSPTPTPAPAPERFNIRGQVTLEQDVIIDTDVPNKAFSYLSNNLSSNAQPIFSPATIIGYVGTHTSEEGEITQDALDVYVLSLDGENVQITLDQAVSNADHDIFLYDSDQLSSPIEFSANISSQENINFSGSGIFYLVVNANQNRIGSKYSLSIEQGLQSYGATKSNTAYDTGEFLVGNLNLEKKWIPNILQNYFIGSRFKVGNSFVKTKIYSGFNYSFTKDIKTKMSLHLSTFVYSNNIPKQYRNYLYGGVDPDFTSIVVDRMGTSNQFKVLGDVYYSGGIRGIDLEDPSLASSENFWMIKIDQSLPYLPGKLFIDIAGSPSFIEPFYGVLGVALGPFIIPLLQQWDDDPYPKNIDWIIKRIRFQFSLSGIFPSN